MKRAPLLMTQRHRMSRYYGFHSRIYDVTRWMFLFGRRRIVQDLTIRPGETIIEIGCGTGHNFDSIQTRLENRGRIIGVDCSSPMLSRSSELVRRRGWSNVELLDDDYGRTPVLAARADVVLFSYSLSMIPAWQQALKCAKSELKPGGRIGIVDFGSVDTYRSPKWFSEWLSLNHVEVDRPYVNVLTSMYHPKVFREAAAFQGLWKYFRFVGTK